MPKSYSYSNNSACEALVSFNDKCIAWKMHLEFENECKTRQNIVLFIEQNTEFASYYIHVCHCHTCMFKSTQTHIIPTNIYK